jgi:Ser-tRNA(Ala) deacylase AlaX
MLELETLDLNPCGGTHLRSLSEIQLIKVRSMSG